MKDSYWEHKDWNIIILTAQINLNIQMLIIVRKCLCQIQLLYYG